MTRTFLIGLSVLGFHAILAAPGPADEPLTLHFHGDRESNEWRGVQLGVDEANVLGEFTGQTWTLRPVPDAASKGDPAPLAVLTTATGDELDAVAERYPESPVFGLRDRSDAQRQSCRPQLLHVPPSESMLRDARAQWLETHPNADAASLEARAWHEDFVKFAARDLNGRYAKAHGRPMDDGAWSGWMAVKFVIEAVTRGGHRTPGPLLEELRNEFEVDGQKGVPMSFRGTGQLRQPLLLVSEGNLLGEAPVRGVADLEDLDTLGLLTCTKDSEK